MKKFIAVSAVALVLGYASTNLLSEGVSNYAVYAKKYAPNKAVTTDLTTGSDWIVGEDIKAGTYDLSTTTGSGNVTSNGSGDLNIILGSDSSSDIGQLSKYRTILKKGESINISGIPSVHFEAADTSHRIKQGQLSAGEYKIGRDIKPGRYTISLVEGTGNISTNDGSLNEIFDTDTSMGVTQTTVRLHKGSTLTFDVQTIQLDK